MFIFGASYLKDPQSEKTGFNSSRLPRYDSGYCQSVLQVTEFLHLRMWQSRNLGTSRWFLFVSWGEDAWILANGTLT